MTKVFDIVNGDDEEGDDDDGSLKPNGGYGDVEVVRNYYSDGSVDRPISDGNEGNGDDDGNRYGDPEARYSYEPSLSTEFVDSTYGVAPEYVADEVRGEVIIVGNDTGTRIVEVAEESIVSSALAEVLANKNALQVLSARNAKGKELQVFLVVSRIAGSAEELVYDRRVFFGGSEVLPDSYGIVYFAPFGSEDVDGELVGEMFKAYGKMVETNLAVVIDEVEDWLRQLAAMDSSSIGVDTYGKQDLGMGAVLNAGGGRISGDASEATMSGQELLDVLRVDCSELTRVGNLISVGELFRTLMPPTPMNRMIAHMVESPVRTISAFIDEMGRAKTPDDVQFCLSGLYKNLNRLYAIASKFLPLIAEDGVLPHAVNIRDMCEGLRECIGDADDKAKVTVYVDPKIEGLLSRAIAWPIVENALYNAIKSGADEILMTAEVIDGAVVVSITDNGVSVPKAVLEHLFHDPVKSTTGGSGRGSSTASEVFNGLVTREIFKDLGVSELPGREKFGIGLVPGEETKRFWISMPLVDDEARIYLDKVNGKAQGEEASA